MGILSDFIEMPPALCSDTIQVWQVDLRQSPERLIALAATLSADEQQRAARFRQSEHRNRFIAGRGLLRQLLGTYLNQSAATLRFGQGLHGKPVLIGNEANAGLHFNLSHSGDRALYALAQREVGVDVEYQTRRVNCFAVAERICTASELAFLRTIPGGQLTRAFFACWTRKEALAKALGYGLAGDLSQFAVCQVNMDENRCARWFDCTFVHDAEGQKWGVLNMKMENGWMGALAAKGTDWHPHCHWEVD